LYLEYNKYKNVVKSPLQPLTQQQSTQPNLSTNNFVAKPLEEFNFNKIINLDYLFSDKYGHLICRYLDYKDILNLRLSHKFINAALNSDSRYYFLMAKQVKSKWLKIRSDLLKRLNIHRDLAAKIPDPYMKHLYSKYVRNRETIGEYMVSSVIQAEKFFNMVLDYEVTTKTESSSGTGFFSKLMKKPDPKPLPTNQPQKIPPQNQAQKPLYNPNMQQQQQPVTPTNYDQMDLFNQITPPTFETQQQPVTVSPQFSQPSSGNIMDLYKNIEAERASGLVYSKTDNDYLEDPFEMPEEKREIFSSYYVNNPLCIFIQSDAYKNAAEDKKNMLQKANTFVEDVFKALNKRKGVVSENQDVLIHLLQVYSKLLIYSKVLLQECKEMEGLKDYTLSKYEEVKVKVTTLENSVEDSKEAVVTEKRLKDVFSKKALDLEAQLHTQNVRILKDSETLINMKNQVKTLEEETQKLTKERQDHENKVKVLVKEVKNLRAKNKELEETNTHVMEGYHDIKITFDNLNIDLDNS